VQKIPYLSAAGLITNKKQHYRRALSFGTIIESFNKSLVRAFTSQSQIKESNDGGWQLDNLLTRAQIVDQLIEEGKDVWDTSFIRTNVLQASSEFDLSYAKGRPQHMVVS